MESITGSPVERVSAGKHGRLRRRHSMGAICAIAFACMWLWSCPTGAGENPLGQISKREFEAVAWQATPLGGDPTSVERLRMVDDLVGEHLIPGLAKEGVLGLLGKPDDVLPPLEGVRWFYWWLGQNGADAVYLAVRISDSEGVLETDIHVLKD